MTETTPNTAQQSFWSTGPGRHWVRLHRELDILHERLTGLILDAADPQPGERVVDIGCGAGAVAIAAAQRVGPEGHVLGLDISAPLVAVGRERAAELTICAPDFVVADAQVWAHEGAPFDLCVSRMGLMFFADPVAGFANLLAHLRPGGRLVFAAWAAAEHNGWFRIAAEEAAARLGPSAPGDPHAPGPTAFADRARVEALLAEAGAARIRSEEVATTLNMPGGTAEAAALARHIGPVAAQLRSKEGSEVDAQAILAAVERRFAEYDTPEGCEIPARINLFSAIRP
ncbi:class I SAM-dependent methyltransferase [Salipiger abyssi]|uniref:class I SAM-dependent methyltransferase n=1 Tax=Salipiger abyssi TaxID=1250539 RepID=UPI001A8D37AA|nr:class I SAM-dependent methyltransferase [Salipiger abyssi]MBN9889103.1 methyltransferase domain-containing protein [Salipiger abyssi]